MNKIKEKLLKEIKHLERMKDGDLQLDCGLPIKKEVANKLFRHSLAERNLWELKAKLQQYEEDIKEFNKILDELRTNNPYPTDIFTGRTEEGKIGQYGRIVYNNALEDVKKEIKQRIKEKNE